MASAATSVIPWKNHRPHHTKNAVWIRSSLVNEMETLDRLLDMHFMKGSNSCETDHRWGKYHSIDSVEAGD